MLKVSFTHSLYRLRTTTRIPRLYIMLKQQYIFEGYIYWLLLTDYDLIKEYFEFDLAFDANEFQCLKTLTEEQLSNGFPLWVSYYLFQ